MNASAYSSGSLLSLESVSLSIHGADILNDVCLSVDAGESLGIIGESGSGKSLTALSIMQLLPRGSLPGGTVRFAGRDLNTLDEQALCDLRGGDIGMIFQEPMTALNPVQTIGAQVSESIRLHRHLDKVQALEQTAQTLERVGLPNDKFPLNRYPHELSGGQRQRVVIAIAIACQPRLLIADEPTTALDVTTQAGILDLLRSLQREKGLALILISHDLAVVSSIADRIAVMKSGRVVETGMIDEVFYSPRHDYTKLLINSSTLSQISTRVTDAYTGQVSVHSVDDRPALLEVRDLICEYRTPRRGWFAAPGRFRAVDAVSFTVREGECLGLVGESGCGKSTLTRALLGLLPLHSGSVVLRGEQVSDEKAVSRRVRQQMQVVFQDPYGSFNPRHRVRRLIAEPLHVLDEKISDRQIHSRVDELLEHVGLLSSDSGKYIHEFSGGQRQRIAIARALIINPALIILDEAVSALDVSVRAQIIELLHSLAREHSLAYLFISHDLSVVRRVTERVMVMQSGRIVEQGETQNVFDRPAHAYTKQLIQAIPTLNLPERESIEREP